MINESPRSLLDLTLDYVNLCLRTKIVSESICRDIISHIFNVGLIQTIITACLYHLQFKTELHLLAVDTCKQK